MTWQARYLFYFYHWKSLRNTEQSVDMPTSRNDNADNSIILSHIRYILSMNDKLYRLWCRTVYSENNPTHISPTVISHMSILVLTQITFAASVDNFIVGIWKLSKYALVGLRHDSSQWLIYDTLFTGKEQPVLLPELLANYLIITRKYIKFHGQLSQSMIRDILLINSRIKNIVLRINKQAK